MSAERPSRRRFSLVVLLSTGIVLGAVLYPTVQLHLRAASLLLRIKDPTAQDWPARYRVVEYDEHEIVIPTPNGLAPGRIYIPRGIAHPPGMVVVHGVHHLGIQEPRLVNFSRALAASGIGPESRPRMQLLLDHKSDTLAPEFLARIPRHQDEMALVSPRGHLDSLRVPVLLLHGSGDNVIPAAETLWLASEVRPQYLRQALISPVITHVEVGGKPSRKDEWALVRFMADMLKEADSLRP